MPQKVTWKKGMRLSTDVFEALDKTSEQNIKLANLISTGGRFGLISVGKPFELSVNINNNILEVVSLCCHGVTKSGMIVDINFDSHYSNTFDTRVSIPTESNYDSFLLIVRYHCGQWREVNEMHSEPAYSFELVGENSLIDSNSLPIGCIVNQYGWRLNETDFVPPCLYVNAHPKYIELVNRTRLILKSISDKCLDSKNCVARHLLGVVWSSVVNACIDIDNFQYELTPEFVLTSIQKVVSAFLVGCSVEEYISLENAEPFVMYYNKPFNSRNIYKDIERGLELCSEIAIKMDSVCAMTETRQESEEKPKPNPRPAPDPKPKPAPQPIEI